MERMAQPHSQRTMSLGFRATDGILMHVVKIYEEVRQMTEPIEIEPQKLSLTLHDG